MEIDSNGYERDASGHFKQSDIGASSFEQSTAGVNSTDSYYEARSKIINQEIIDQGSSQSTFTDRVYVPPPNRLGFMVLWFLVFIFGTEMVFGSPDYITYKWPPDEVLESGLTAGGLSADIVALSRQNSVENIKSVPDLFKQDAPIARIFDHCRQKCMDPDIMAFAAFSKYRKAETIEDYEDQVCRDYFHAERTNHYPVPTYPVVHYKFDLMAHECVVANPDDVKAFLREKNSAFYRKDWRMHLYIGFLSLMGFGLVKIQQRHRRLLKDYKAVR